MCNCGNGEISQFVKGSPGNPCAQVTTSALDLYRLTIQCVIDGNKYEGAGITAEDAALTVTQISQWISLKQQDPDNCTYIDFLPVFQKMVGRIINSGVCQQR